MSANLVVDLGNTTVSLPSFPSTAVAADAGIAETSGGIWSSLSGAAVGSVVDLIGANTNTNVYVGGQSFGSGPLLIGVQTSDSTTSGSFTDPTSGLPAGAFPGAFVSGGFLVIGSGAATDTFRGIFGSGVSGQVVQSGFLAFSHFQRPHRFARIVTFAGGFYEGTVQAGFVANMKTTGSGTGFTFAPSSGTVEV